MHLHSLLFLLTIVCVSPLAQSKEVEQGVSLELATQRKASLSEIQYKLFFKLEKTGEIESEITVRAKLENKDQPLVLDFSPGAEKIRAITILKPNREPELIADYVYQNGHIIVPAKYLTVGFNSIGIKFTAGEQSLNRNETFLYTLLVPDRASTVFPCFDQPDLKAKFELKLDLPPNWTASANGMRNAQSKSESGRTSVSYSKTKPISTYLFAFAAGEFKTISREQDGHKMTMYYRESDKKKVERNVDAIFETHAFSIDWMEEYTGIKYPFKKFDFVLIPSFQYGGMEHIGNIFYNADQLFLDKSATQNQKLNRASLIAHETAHMWFGNLVTMKWFDDVWLKEVFANFMAAKIVNPSFPAINHDLGFMLKHHPSAYGEDRTAGTYPIQQKLGNLKNAGTLYGRIIYMKAPIVMRQLETLIGQKELQSGLQEYLSKFSFDNAVWDDLIDILDKKTEIDLKQWSAAWVKEPGTPEIDSKLTKNSKRKTVLRIKQTRQTPGQKFWAQQIDIKVIVGGKIAYETRAMIEGETTEVSLPESIVDYDFYLANGSELGYGYFRLDPKSKSFLLKNIQLIKDDVTRGAAWLALYESLIRSEQSTQKSDAQELLRTIITGLKTEREPLNRQNILGQLSTVYWKFLSPKERANFSADIESTLWQLIDSKPTASDANAKDPSSPKPKSEIGNDARSSYYKTLVGIASTKPTVDRLLKIWENESDVNGLPLAENDFIKLSYELAIRLPEKSDSILKRQMERLKNEDRKKRFAFVMPSLSPDQQTRDDFFESLKKLENRRPERWALDGLNYLHHPLRADKSEKYILPSLELLEEIQMTGDIFFPKRWLVSTLGGHRSPSAAQTVQKFLSDRPDYSPRLKNKILQAADLLIKVGK